MILNLVVTEQCNMACKYCVSGDTQIMMANNTTKSIKDIIIGDKIISIDENETIKKDKKNPIYINFEVGTVTKLFNPRFVDKLYHIITENDDELYITGEHPLLTNRKLWKNVEKISKSKEQILYDVDFPIYNNIDFINDEQYMIGYMTACWLGDGSFKKYLKSEKYCADTYAIRFVVKDDNIMSYFKKCLDYFGYKYTEYPFKISTKYNIIKDAFVCRKEETYNKILDLIETNLNKNTNKNYYRGFLSGIYDCEGCLNKRDIKINNGNPGVLNQIETALKYFNYEYTIKQNKQFVNIPVSTIRLSSSDRKSFLETVYPQCEYKRIYWYQTKLGSRVNIKSIEEIDFNNYVYNIETNTHTYIANNIMVHNCYMNNNPLHMTTEVIDKTIEQLPKMMKMIGDRTCSITYFGGEPLINLDLIKYTHNKVKDLDYISSEIIISNMLLIDDDIIDYLNENNINISWSFDGLWNKTNRLMADDTESFDLYMQKLSTIRKITNGCKVMVSPSSVDTMVENLKFFVEDLGIYCPNYTLVRDDIWNDSDIKRFKVEIKKVSNLIIKYFRSGLDVRLGLFTLPILDIIMGDKKGKRPFGCFAGYDGIAVMPNGDIYPCARFGSNKKNLYGNVYTGLNYSEYKQVKDKTYLNPQEYEKCKECKLYNYCNAGCTYSELENNRQPLDSICKLYHIIYKEALYIYNELNKDDDKYKNIMLDSLNHIE